MRRTFEIFLCILFLLSGCRRDLYPPPEHTLQVTINSEPTSLDPRKGGDMTSSIFQFLMYDGLFRRDENGNAVPGLASSVDISEDRKTYVFHLHEAYWSDGNAITAWDFEKTWKDLLDPQFPSMDAHLLYPIVNAFEAKLGQAPLSTVGIEALDARTLRVELGRPTPYFLELISFCALFPVSHESIIDGAQAINVSSGPFMLSDRRFNDLIVLKKNPLFRNADNVHLDEIRFDIVKNEMTSLLLYEKGEIDFFGHPLTHFPIDAVPQLKDHRDFRSKPAPGSVFAAFNVDLYPFNNKHIRRAFSFAVDRFEIVSAVTQLGEVPATNAIPSILKDGRERPYFFDGDLRQAKVEFRKGLKELGIKLQDFPQVTYYHSLAETDRKVAQVLQDYWFNAFGIKVRLQAMDKAILMHHLRTGSFQLAQGFWMAQFNDPASLLERYTSKYNEKNYSNWESPDFQNAMKTTYVIEDREKRLDSLEAAEQILLEEMPIIPIYHLTSAFLAKPHLGEDVKTPNGSALLENFKIQRKNKGTISNILSCIHLQK